MYSRSVLDHFHHPRNVGEIADATIVVEASIPSVAIVETVGYRLRGENRGGEVQGGGMRSLGRVRGSRLNGTDFKDPPAELSALTPVIEEGLGGLPPASHHAAVLAVDALKRFLEQMSKLG